MRSMYLEEERKISQLAEKMKPDAILIFENNPQANYSFVEKLELTNAEIIHSFTTPYSNSNIYFVKLSKDEATIKVYDYNKNTLVEEISVKKGDTIILDCQALARASE